MCENSSSAKNWRRPWYCSAKREIRPVLSVHSVTLAVSPLLSRSLHHQCFNLSLPIDLWLPSISSRYVCVSALFIFTKNSPAYLFCGTQLLGLLDRLSELCFFFIIYAPNWYIALVNCLYSQNSCHYRAAQFRLSVPEPESVDKDLLTFALLLTICYDPLAHAQN